MSKFSKKLLSWLCVMAMVLSMVPVFQLPAFAAEEATEETFVPDETVTSAVPAAAQEAIAKAATIQAEAAKLDFSGNYCPVCGPDVQVTWTKLTRAYIGSNNGDKPNYTDMHPHYYWDPADFENGTASHTWMNWLQNTKGASMCIHLNGMRFENVYSRIHWSGGTLNIMGEGTFINSGAADKQAFGVFQVGGGTVNLYGGTFIGTGTGAVAPSSQTSYYATVGLNNANAVLNMYEGVVLSVNEKDTQGASVAVASGTFNLYGGEIRGGKGYPFYDTDIKTYDNFAVTGGNVFMRYSTAKFNMYGGKITGGTAPRGGNIAMYEGATFTQYAGEISGGTATETQEGHGGGNVKLQSGTFTQNGGVIKNGSANYGGNIDTRSKLYIKGLVMDGSAEKGGSNLLVASGTLTYIQAGGRVLRGEKTMNIMVYGSGNLYMQDGLVYGGQAERGANIYLSGNGNLQMTGGVVRDGVATKEAGNIFAQNKDAKIVISGGQILNGQAGTNGGNIRSTQGQITISGGTISGGVATEAGGNIYYESTTASTDTVKYGEYMLQITGGTITGGNAGKQGGNIFAKGSNGERTMNIDNAVVSDGVSGEAGGNIYAESINVNVGANAQILNGISNSTDYKGGGNIAFTGSKVLTTAGKIMNGKTTGAGGGGNISIMSGADLEITGGVIANGRTEGATGTSWGGNIRSYNTDIIMTGGLIYGGYCKASESHNIGAMGEGAGYPKLYVTDGTIVGDITISAPVGDFKGTDVKLAGAAKILNSYQLEDGSTVRARANTLKLSALHDISGLNADARIVVKGNAGAVFTAPYTGEADLSQVFSAWDPQLTVAQNEAGAFQLVEKVIEIPEKPAAELGGNNYTDEAWEAISKAAAIQAEDMAAHVAAGTCPICGVVNWVEAKKPGELKTNNAKYHYYIDAETKPDYTYNWCTLYGENQTLCLALLNGDTPVEVPGLIGTRGSSKNSTINILGDGVIVNNDKTGDKIGAFRSQGTNPTLNFYGGTFTRPITFEDNAAPSLLLTVDAGTVNIFEGVTIGPDTLDLTKANYNVRIIKGTLNMYGGTIQNGVSAYAEDNANLTKRFSGNITLVEAGATFNMYGGTVKNGAYKESVPGATNGGNIMGQKDGQFINIYGGVIEGGQADNGGNINIYGGAAKFTMLGGTVKDGVATGIGGNILLQSTPAEIGGYALIENGEAKGQGGGNVHYGGILNITGGVIRNGKATAASGASGGNLRGNGTLVMTDGLIQNGFAAESATGGGNLYATSGKSVTITGGTWEGGEAKNGGNIYIYNGNLTIGGDAVITGGKATNNGGNIFKYGSDAGYSNTNTHFVVIGGNAIIKEGEAGNQGGNISLTGSKLSIADNVQILDGHARIGGNVIVSGVNRKGAAIPDTDPVKYEYNMERALLEITGGVIKGGTATNATQANVYAVNADMVMTGGEIYAADGNTANGGGLRISQSSLYLGGDAFIGRADGIQDCCMQIEPSGKLFIDASWTGSALVQYNEAFAGGETIVTDGNYYTTWGSFTYAADETTGLVSFECGVGGPTAFTGKLIQERAPFVQILPVADGTVKVANAGVISANGSVWYESTEEALADYDINEDVAIYLSGEATINEDIKLDLAGSKLTLKGAGKVYGIDTRNDGFALFGEITIDESADITYAAEQTEDGKRYIALLDGNKLSFHRIEMTLTHVTLRTEGTPGMYYKAAYTCDEMLRDRVETYGVVLSLANMPGADFETEADLNKATAYGAEAFKAAYANGIVDTNSGAIVGIMKQKNSKEVNTQNAERAIYANAYLKLDVTGTGDYTTFMADTANQGKTKADEGFNGVAYSLLEVLAAVNANWDNYSDEEKLTIATFIESWAPFITDEAVALLGTLLNKIFG